MGVRSPNNKAGAWHVDDGVASDGSGRPLRYAVRRTFSPEYKLAILADWRRQHRQGLLRASIGRTDGGRGGPSLSEVARLREENERLRVKLAQAEAVITVQGKVHALLEEISKSAAAEES